MRSACRNIFRRRLPPATTRCRRRKCGRTDPASRGGSR
ncbi:MAG: hypothetical protein H6887_08550 [Hoeflea sp.]|nr:hypothetical protein [Hoeflea sp.]